MPRIKTINPNEFAKAVYDTAVEQNPFVAAALRVQGLVSYRNTEGDTNEALDNAKARAVGSHEPHADADPFAGATHRARMGRLTEEQRTAVKSIAGEDAAEQARVIGVCSASWDWEAAR